MECQRPIRVELSEKAQLRRQARIDAPFEYRFARYVNVPCGKCFSCLQRKRSEWMFRLYKELETSSSAYFVTLTYDDLHVPTKNGRQCVSKKDIQKFFKRLRFNIRPFQIRYFLVSEYGPKTLRPHYHMILFNFPNELKNKLDDYLLDSWQNGFITIAPVTSGRISYVCSYCLDKSKPQKDLEKNFMLCSKRPFIGSSYLDNASIRGYHDNTLDNFGHVCTNGKVYTFPLSRTIKDKLFSDDQNFEISQRNNIYYDKRQRELKKKQKIWLMEHGYNVNRFTMESGFYGSPLFNELTKYHDFNIKCLKKCKNKKI